MNFDYSTFIYNTTYRPQRHSLNLNEDAHCDNEVNLILEKPSNQHLIKQSKLLNKKQPSLIINQADQYYFIPIQEQTSSTILSGSNVTDNSSSLLLSLSFDISHPSIFNLFNETSPNYFLSITTSMNSSDNNKTLTNYHLNDTDLTTLLVSSLIPKTFSLTEIMSNNLIDNNNDLSNNTLDEVFLNQVNDLVYSPTMSDKQQQSFGPPPGFENFLFNSSSTTTNTNPTKSSINNGAIQTPPVSSSDTINFSQLLQSTTIADPPQQLTVGNIRSSSSSHSSYASDDQSSYYPVFPTHPYSSLSSSSSSSYAKSQIYPTNKPSFSTTTNSVAKPHLPNSLSLNQNNNNNNNNFSSPSSISLVTNSTTTSPIPSVTIPENDKRIIDRTYPSNLTIPFSNNEHTDFSSSSKFSANLRTSSSASSTSSIDDALKHLTPKEQNPKHFHNQSTSFFSCSKSNVEQEQAVHDNLNYLASILTGIPTTTTEEDSIHAPSYTYSQASSLNIQQLIDNLNDICYKGFDELNAVIQEQRWVQNYFNINSSLIPSLGKNLNHSKCSSSSVLIVSEYFIFKCKKFEISAYYVFDFLSNTRVELRLKDLMFVFKSWKEAILQAEKIHQEEDNKLRLTFEQAQSYYITDAALKSAFERVSSSLRQLSNLTQQVRAAYQYATLNVFQTASRQQQQTQSQPLTSNSVAQSQSIPWINGSIRTTP